MGERNVAGKQVNVQEGDRFLRAENPGTVWVVLRAVEFDGLPLHYQIAPEQGEHPKLTFSVSALMDRQYFQRVA